MPSTVSNPQPEPRPLHVWITGANKGIGAAIAATLTDRGHHVSGGSRTTGLDVADASSVRRWHDTIIGQHGPVDVLVNNAGIATFTPLVDTPDELFDEQMAVNVRGVFLCTKAVLPSMIERHAGQVITINSIATITAYAGCSVYGASKAACSAMMRSVRTEVRDYGIKVHDVLVGATATEIWSDAMREERSDDMMTAADVAGCIATLVDGFFHPRMHVEELVLRPQRGDL